MEYLGSKLFSTSADSYFGSDYYTDYGDGSSSILRATVRYINMKHIKDQSKFLKVKVSAYSDSESGNDIAKKFGAPNTITILKNRKSNDSVLAINLDGWVALDKPPYPVSPYLSSLIKGIFASVFANKETRSAIIFVNKYTEKWLELFSSMLPKILIWVYPESIKSIDEVGEDEYSFFKSILEGNSEVFTKIIDEQYAASEIENLWVFSKLRGWNSNVVKRQIDNYKYAISRYDSNIEEYEESIKKTLVARDKDLKILHALMESVHEDNDDLANLFKTHKQLEFVKTGTDGNNDNYLIFTICETLEYYDEDMLKRMLSNKSSYIQEFSSETLAIVKAIFIDKKAKLRVRSCFRLTNVSALRSAKNDIEWDFRDSLRQPHLGHYNCLGANEQYITNALKKGDYVIAIEQAIAATKNLNWGDSTVVNTFLNEIEDYNYRKCLIMPDGSEMTIKEFYDNVVNVVTEASADE